MKRRDFGIGPLALSMSLTLAGCLRPDLSTSAPTQPAAGGAEPRGADERRLVIWDGAHIKPRNVGVGRSGHLDFWDGGKSWAECDAKPKCEATLAAKSGVGVGGRKGLEFHAEGSGWAGSGWSWFDWYPTTAGTDLSPYTRLTFQIRVEAKSPDAMPDPTMVAVQLACGPSSKTTSRAMVQKYDANFDDGRWHKLVVPMADLRNGDGANFDWRTAWELRLSTWSATARNFNIYIDQIAAEN